MEPEALFNKVFQNERIVFKYKIEEKIEIDKIDFVVSYGKTFKSILPKDLVYENGVLEFTYELNKKGRFDVHLKIEDAIVASYSLEVKKRKNNMSLAQD